MKKVLISHGGYHLFAANLAKEFEALSVSTDHFENEPTEHFLNKLFVRINKYARSLRLIPKGFNLFSWSKYSKEKFLEAQLSSRIEKFKPDLIFCIHGPRFGEELLKKIKIPKIGWWIEPEKNKALNVPYAKLFDVYLSYDSDTVNYLQNKGICSQYQCHATSPNDFYPINAKKEFDLLFYGNWSPWREDVLLAAYAVTNNIALYGDGWIKKSRFFAGADLKKIYKGISVSGNNLNIALNSSKAILNSQRMKWATAGLDTRAFDVLASGNLLITDVPKDLSKHFVHGEDLLIYKNVDELKDLIKQLLVDEKQFDGIRKSGREKVLENYTYHVFCQKLINDFLT